MEGRKVQTGIVSELECKLRRVPFDELRVTWVNQRSSAGVLIPKGVKDSAGIDPKREPQRRALAYS